MGVSTRKQEAAAAEEAAAAAVGGTDGDTPKAVVGAEKSVKKVAPKGKRKVCCLLAALTHFLFVATNVATKNSTFLIFISLLFTG